jgi:hypothetical protein
VRLAFVVLALASLSIPGCTCQGGGELDGGSGGGAGGGTGGSGGGTPSDRCETELERFKTGTTGTLKLKQVADAADLIGGPTASGKIGDYLLQNEKIKVIVQGFDRHIGAQPYGGTILDADLVRPAGEPGQDQFGETGLLYNFGRTLDPDKFEILSDGSDGRAVVLAVTGLDTANDYLSIRNQLRNMVGTLPVTDPYLPVPLKLTNYFILNPGEQRVRFVTAFCNTSVSKEVVLAVGDLTDPGYVLELFNPQACTLGFGSGGLCFGLDRMNWFGYQGNGLAYGYAPYKAGSPLQPEPQNAVLTVAGITGSIIGAAGLNGLLTWFDASKTSWQGELRIPALGNGVFSRDFVIGKDLGEVNNLIEATRNAVTGNSSGEVEATVTSNGAPLAGARVVFQSNNGNVVLVTGADGKARGQLNPRQWSASAWAAARNPSTPKMVTISAAVPATVSFDLINPRTLTVNVREANGGPMPGRVTVICASGPCPAPQRTLVTYGDVHKDPMPDNVQAIGFAGASGVVTLQLPPAQYLVLVSRGPEYSIHPNGFPTTPGTPIDVRFADSTVNAVLARVIDTTGWMSVDTHVHAVNSPDSIVDNATRVAGFAADGFDIIVSTDHDYVTDFGPTIVAAGLTTQLASVTGEEISTMDWGHYNFFPLPQDPLDGLTRGAVDWAGGRGPTLSPALLFAEGRKRGVKTIQINHPRGFLGSLTHLRADTDTFATHAAPESFRMAAVSGATSTDTKLLSADFNAMEILNNADDEFDAQGLDARGRMNDWMTLLSRGFPIAATGTSDTHYRAMTTGWRTFVEMGMDAPAQFDPMLMSARLNAMRAVVTNGPFAKISVYRVDAAGAQVTPSVGPGGTVAQDTRELGVTVDVQVPEYLDLTKVELYLHKTQDDLACPIDPASPKAPTTRVACNGVLNSNWPASGISATQTIALNGGDLQTVTSDSGVTYRRYRKVVNFRLPAPTTDNWVVAMIYGTRTLFPLNFNPPGGSGAVTPTAPFALTNPVFVDANGNGYDKPPFKPSGNTKGLTKHHADEVPVEQPLSIDEMVQRWGGFVGTH